MQPIAVLGPDADSVATRLTDRLDGRILRIDAVDRTASATSDAESEADATVEFTAAGDWTATGSGADLTALLDRFAPTHTYAVITGETRLRVPTLLVGDDQTDNDPADNAQACDDQADNDPTADETLDPDAVYEPAAVPGDVIATAQTPAGIDIETVIEALAAAEPWITLEELIDRAKADPAADRSGAIASFTGRVRAKDAPDDDRTQQLAFEAYDGVAGDRMETIATELEDRDGVFRVLMHHRTGVIPDGEDIVFVVVLAGHREEAFRTVADGIDRLKEEVPIFKKETTDRDQFWVHQR